MNVTFCKYACIGIHVYEYMYIYVCMYVHVHDIKSASMPVCQRMYAYMHGQIGGCMYVCMYMYVHMFASSTYEYVSIYYVRTHVCRYPIYQATEIT